jgi:hypothetical protein
MVSGPGKLPKPERIREKYIQYRAYYSFIFSILITLSYSSKGPPGPPSVHTSLTQNCLKLTIVCLDFLTTSFLYLDIGFF